MKHKTLATVISALLINTVCSLVDPDYAEAIAAVEKDWVSANDSKFKDRNAQLATWWQVFGDPILDKLIAEARAQLGVAVGNEYPQK